MQIAIGLFPGFTALDTIGPYQVFTNVPDAEVVVCAATAGSVADDHDLLRLDVMATFGDVPAPDILLVPGGLITRKLARDGHPVIDWIRCAHPHTDYTTSVCTGALLLGAAGLLDGRRATTHWVSYEALRSDGARATEQRVVRDGKIFTAAGVSAGIDLALTLVGQIAGPDVAQAIHLGLEYDPQPPSTPAHHRRQRPTSPSSCGQCSPKPRTTCSQTESADETHRHRGVQRRGSSALLPKHLPAVAASLGPARSSPDHSGRDSAGGMDALVRCRRPSQCCRDHAAVGANAPLGRSGLRCLSDNSAHLAWEWVQNETPIPWLHIGRVVASEANARGHRRVGILGTRFTMDGDVYRDAFSSAGIDTVVPDQHDAQTVDRIIFEEVVHSTFTDESRHTYYRVIEHLALRECDAVALACTEIPLLVHADESPLPTFDSTRLLARAAVERAIA